MLKLKEEITKEQPNPSMCNLVVEVAIDKLCALERKVNMAVLRLCITVFSCADDPFLGLLNHLEKDAEFANEFDLYFDRLNQICMFSIACSSECKFRFDHCNYTSPQFWNYFSLCIHKKCNGKLVILRK